MYSFMFFDNEIVLPEYTFDIADTLEMAEKQRDGASSYKTAMRTSYDAIVKVIGEEKTNEVIGDFKTCDPNKISAFFLQMCDCYNEPIDKLERERFNKKLDGANIDKVVQLADAMRDVTND